MSVVQIWKGKSPRPLSSCSSHLFHTPQVSAVAGQIDNNYRQDFRQGQRARRYLECAIFQISEGKKINAKQPLLFRNSLYSFLLLSPLVFSVFLSLFSALFLGWIAGRPSFLPFRFTLVFCGYSPSRSSRQVQRGARLQRFENGASSIAA